MADWGEFFGAQVGASAALAGLIFVGISISLDQVLKSPHLVFRAATALGLMLTTLVISSVLLAPFPSDREAGYVVLGVAAVSWLANSLLAVAGMRRTPSPYRRTAWWSVAMVQAATVPIVISGIVLLADGDDGLFWLLPGFMICYVVALLDSWVLLVETHR